MSALLSADGLRVAYGPAPGVRRQAEVLHGLTFHVGEGETLGLVGESGSGKTTIGRAVLGLVRPTGGSIRYRDHDLITISRRARRALASEIQAVFQDPYSSLNPAMTIGQILSEPLLEGRRSREQVQARVVERLHDVHLPEDILQRLPNEFSGGQRQRIAIAIARALMLDPRLVVCDEPTSALDVTTQLGVFELLIDIQNKTGVTYVFISHDLAVVRHISHRVAVLYRGDIVETGTAGQVTRNPDHPYTKQLVLASPVIDPEMPAGRRAERQRLKGGGGAVPRTG